MATVGEYLATLCYDLIFFSNDVQTTTIAMAVTGSLCFSVLWAILHVVNLVQHSRGTAFGHPKVKTGLTGQPSYLTGKLDDRPRVFSRSFVGPRGCDMPCIRCARVTSDRKCRYGMCSQCCLGKKQCQVHGPHADIDESDPIVVGPTGLDLSQRCVQSVPDRLGFIGAQLTYLNLSDNNLSEIPADIGCLLGLRDLQLHNNNLTHIPATLGSLSQLSELNISHNQLVDLPDSVMYLSSLNYLNLAQNNITNLSPLVKHLLLLEELYLGSNCLTCIPSEIGSLFNLKLLSIRHNPIVSLPNGIGQLICLEHLDMVSCCLESLPSTLGKCLSLRTLNVGQNRLSYLPSQLHQLQNLRELIVTNNCLSSFPVAMETMQLTTFEASGNPLITEDASVVVTSNRVTTEALPFPPLLEIVARKIACEKIGQVPLLPASMQDYLHRFIQCSQCRQRIFSYSITRIRFGKIGNYPHPVPLKETLCSPHLPSKCPFAQSPKQTDGNRIACEM